MEKMLVQATLTSDIKVVVIKKMSLILARENASNLLDRCSRTLYKEWRTSDKRKVRIT